jgi:hypothetical protein
MQCEADEFFKQPAHEDNRRAFSPPVSVTRSRYHTGSQIIWPDLADG